jgi:hypothetical protein
MKIFKLASDSYLLRKDSAPSSHLHESDDNTASVQITIFCLTTNDETLQVLVQSSKYYTCTLPNLWQHNFTIFPSILDIPRIQQSVKREPHKSSTSFTLPTTLLYTHFIFPIICSREQILAAYMTFAYPSFRNVVTFSAFDQNRYTEKEMKYQ